MYHQPVLLTSSIDGLITNPDGTYVDATYGGGGHSKEILRRLSAKGKLFAFDQDLEAHANKVEDERLILIQSNYRFFENYLRYYKVLPIDGVLADIGVSSHQFDEAERGFSIRYDAPLDMRMDRGQVKSAQTILNGYKEDDLANVLYQYGELKNSRRIAKQLVQQRESDKVWTTQDIRNALKGVIPIHTEQKVLVQLFQALRIEINDELEALKVLLQTSAGVIRKGGRLVIISYHSLEDRLVKNYTRSGNFEGKQTKDLYGNVLAPFRPVQQKAIQPDEAELEQNPRSRSARLRIAEHI